MIADRTRRHGHRQHAEAAGDAGLNLGPRFAERGEGARTPAEHGDKDPRRRLAQALDMADHLVDPHRRLVAEGRRHRVLAMGASGDRHLGAALGEVGQRGERLADQPQDDPMRLPQYQQVAGLGDVLRRCPPMDPAAMRLADDPGELPDERHDGVAGAGKPGVDAGAIEALEPRRAGDRVGRLLRDDAELGLCRSQGDLNVEPGLPAVFLGIERANAGIGHARRGRQLVAHDRCPAPSGRSSAPIGSVRGDAGIGHLLLFWKARIQARQKPLDQDGDHMS